MDNKVVSLEFAIRVCKCILENKMDKLDCGMHNDPIKFLEDNAFEIEDDEWL